VKKCELKTEKRLCVECRQRRARYVYRGLVKADHDHTLCFRCFRSLINRVLAQTLCQESLQITG